MKLIIKRDQKEQKGVFGGHKGVSFLLTYKLQLSPQEQELITRYKVENQVLMSTEAGNTTTVQDLITGRTQEMQDITILLSNEEAVKNACQNFKILLDVMNSFGGEQVIDFDKHEKD